MVTGTGHFENETGKKLKTVSALSYMTKHCQGVTDWTRSLNDLVYKQLCHFRKYSVYALNTSSHLERGMRRFLSVYPKAALFSYSLINNFVFSFITKLVTVVKLSLFIMSTYPMKHSCILQKYTFRPLLLLQLVPCHHIAREMYLQPSHPQMHANSVSRRNSRFVPEGTASFLKSSSNLCFSSLLRSL